MLTVSTTQGAVYSYGPPPYHAYVASTEHVLACRYQYAFGCRCTGRTYVNSNTLPLPPLSTDVCVLVFVQVCCTCLLCAASPHSTPRIPQARVCVLCELSRSPNVPVTGTPATLDITLDPSVIGLGPQHVAVAHDKRVIYYRLQDGKSDRIAREKDYPGQVSPPCPWLSHSICPHRIPSLGARDPLEQHTRGPVGGAQADHALHSGGREGDRHSRLETER